VVTVRDLVRIRYGLILIFSGHPALADLHPVPDILRARHQEELDCRPCSADSSELDLAARLRMSGAAA